jgi:hypothetical protein
MKVKSQVKQIITKNALFIVQRVTAQSKTGVFCDYGVAEAPPGFQAGWSDCMYFLSLFLLILFADLNHEHFERLIYMHFSALRFHPVSIISTPLRAKLYMSSSSLWQASQ